MAAGTRERVGRAASAARQRRFRLSRATWSSIILMVLGLPTGVAGAHDALVGNDLQTQLTGALFLIAGAFMLASSLGLLVKRWRESWAPQSTLVAGASAVLLSGYLFVQQLRYLESARKALLAVWVICAAAAIMAVRLRPWVRHDELRSRAVRPLAIISSLVVPAGLLFSVFQFYYGSIRTGTQFTNALTLSESVTDEGLERHDPAIHDFLVDFHLRNPSSREVRIVRSDYELYGSREAAQPGSVQAFGQALRRDRVAGTAVTARFLEYGPADLLEAGDALAVSGVIEPSAEEDTRLVVGLPQKVVSMYAHLALITTVLVSNGRLQLSSGPARAEQAACFDGYDQCTLTAWRIKPPGWLWLVSRGQQVLETFQFFDLGTSRVLPQGFAQTSDYCIEQDLGQLQQLERVDCSDRKGDIEQLMSLGYVETTTDVPLAERTH